ncbi:hypothetical protein [Nocardia sp. R6R-6]|uniref:hypothetical protein n=1 Tax=Nocardia sp. R6R-6 TaxID=3459303 RepID=UPI00403DBA92
MIPETGYITAAFKIGEGPCERRRVVAWDGDGNALVPDAIDGRLTIARLEPGFQWLDAEAAATDPVALIPGGGWVAEHRDGSTAPVVAWGVGLDGAMRAYVASGDRAVSADDFEELSFTVRHPAAEGEL